MHVPRIYEYSQLDGIQAYPQLVKQKIWAIDARYITKLRILKTINGIKILTVKVEADSNVRKSFKVERDPFQIKNISYGKWN